MKVTNMVKQIPMKHLAFFSLLCSSAASAAERPNIIYIFTDQQTASAMSCAGNPDLHTPNLDRLAAAGVMFNMLIAPLRSVVLHVEPCLRGIIRMQ